MPDQKNPEFSIQRIYVKDISYEAPNTPHVFKEEWKPEINLDINTTYDKLEEDVYEVVLRCTVTAKKADKPIFVAEVKQGGIFLLKDFTAENLPEVLRAFCPNILFPYAREVISDVINRGGFPPLYLAPINFDALYAQQKQQEQAAPVTH